jgi:hypothetical protein
MAEEHPGASVAPTASWTKLFAAFRVALDVKKMLLAAGGLVVTAFGWLVLAAIFYSPKAPEWKDYAPAPDKPAAAKQEAFSSFQLASKRWRLLHELAAPTPDNPSDARKLRVIDFAKNWPQFEALTAFADLRAKGKTLEEIKAELPPNPEFEALMTIADLRAKGKTLEQIKAELPTSPENDSALRLYQNLERPATLPTARLRSWPFSEDRGPNPYLLAEGLLRKDAEGHRSVPWARGEFLSWLWHDQLRVLSEPLTKFLAPIVYFFNSSAGPYIRFYLILVILWTLATWGFFGGAICRIAAVQIARNEKISLRESVNFAKEKFLNLFTAPLFPLIFLGILTLILIAFGLIAGFIPVLGDIVFAGLLWPVVIVFGLIMAVVVVGLVGWPLMNPTIAAEGSDNFDALSRSYSYIYQAFWHYLGYWAVALAYGAVLVFFVGFMGSLVVYLGKWGLSQAPGLQSSNPASDRDPAYLFTYAPTSFGWRDLLIKDSLYAEKLDTVTSSGAPAEIYEFTEDYAKNMKWYNNVGAVFVGVWIGLFFLMIVGFGYSYFWTASTLIYFLMRKHVDDTEMDEVYFEEGETEPPPSSVVATQTPAAKPNTVSLNVVDGGNPAPPATAAVAPQSSAPDMNPPSNPPPGNP